MPRVAIVDYRMGNLFSVQRACEYAGLDATVTSRKDDIRNADGVVLPGVGAFGDAMETLRQLDLIASLREIAQSGTPFMGICLGMQLMMTESFEFGHHQGLDFFRGRVVRFECPVDASGNVLKVPEIGWNAIYAEKDTSQRAWDLSPLRGLRDEVPMYFVHSFYCVPEESALCVSLSRYGHIEFCSSIQSKNVFACQFHPERSGKDGLRIYCNFASMVYNKGSY